jgi:hypothetical protein
MSKHYKFVALVNAKDGQDDAFNAWHTDIHRLHSGNKGTFSPCIYWGAIFFAKQFAALSGDRIIP